MKQVTSPAWLGWWLLALVLTTLVGIALRVDQIGQRSLWADELFTVGIAQFHPLAPAPGNLWFERKQVLHITDGDSFLTAKAAEQSPPLNDLLEKATLNALGTSEWAARLPAAVSACLLLLWAAALAWRERDPWNRRVLTWNLLLLSLYPVLIYYAKDGRAYSLGASFIGAAALLWWQRWRDGLPSWIPLGKLEIALWTAACYSHYNAAVVVVLIGLIELWASWQRRSKPGIQRTLTLGLLFLPWVVLNIHTILFTTKGGVAWGNLGWQQRVSLSVEHILMAVQWPWVVAAMGIVVAWRWLAPNRRSANAVVTRTPFFLLPLVSGVFLVIAALIVAKAGMAHPRYYIFACPLLALWMAMVLAQIKNTPGQVIAATLVVALSASTIWTLRDNKNEDFRSMTRVAVDGAPGDTPFLYPWRPNLNMYRVYLELMLGTDPRPRMHSVSTSGDYQKTCETLAHHERLAVVGHDSGHAVIDGFYLHCGHHWPTRKKWQFDNTFTEHWVRP